MTDDIKLILEEFVIKMKKYDLELKYGKVISPVIKNQQFFEYWSDTLPFYRNIVKEGIRVA